MERGGIKKNYSYPPQNICEGNRVVFETLVKKKDPPSLKKFHAKRAGLKQIIHTSQIFSKVIE